MFIRERNIHRLFEIGVILKGLDGLLETVSGAALFFIGTNAIVGWVAALMQDELSEDPHDAVANYLLHMAQGFSIGDKTFASIYLLSHGVVKMVLVAGLLRDKYWAYPASLAVLGLFILYQLYSFALTHSPGMAALTLFDLIVIALIWHEYRLIRRHLPRE
jgi:uncharacterized membrane protein